MDTAEPISAVIERLAAENPRPVADLARGLPSFRGRPVRPHSLVRWIRKGIKVRGQAVLLEGYRTPGAWWSSEPAIRRFYVALTATKGVQRPASGVDKVAAEAAGQELRRRCGVRGKRGD